MKYPLLTSCIGLILIAGMAIADEGCNPPPDGGKPPKEKNPAFEKALHECSESIKKGSERPDMTQMDTCMETKGFKKPPHPPHDECHHERPNP